MDFLRIRQKARERALVRERQQAAAPAQPAPEPDALPPDAGQGPPPAPSRIEDVLRDELRAVAAVTDGEPAPPLRAVDPARDRGAAADPADPLDEFFWREDETVPRFPDLVAASALPTAPEPERRHEWLTFTLGEEVYALDIHHVREILKAPPLTEVPRAPGHVLGVIMNRGEVIAVFDPRVRLGLPRRATDARARILVCDAGDGSRGLLVDAVSHVVRIAQSAVEPRPPSMGGVAAEFIAGIGRDRNRLYVLLDAVALLADPAPVDVVEVRS